jgi:signal transduction histidine kinase
VAALLLLLLLFWPSPSPAQPEPRRSILLVLPDPPGRPNSTGVLEGVQNALRIADPSIALATDYLSQQEQDRPEFMDRQLAWFREKHRDRHFDAIIVLGPETLRSVLSMRDSVAPGAPVVYCGGGTGRIESLLHRPDVTGSLLPQEMTDNLQIMRRLLPDTRTIALIGGASPVDVSYNARTPAAIRQVFPNVHILDLTRLSIADLKTKLAKLPQNTTGLIGNFFYDPDGHPVFRRELVATLSPSTAAPLFSTGTVAMGAGIVGGSLTDYALVGEHAAEQALRLLRGEAPSSIPIEVYNSARLQFDWHELKRWRIPLDRLPPGSEVLYRPFSIWEQYRWGILLAAAALVLQSALVAVLLIQRRRARETDAARRSAELEIAAARDQISHLNRTASLGELAASIAHEINQPLAGVLSNAQAARHFLNSPQPDVVEIRDALRDICDDVTRAGDIVHRMRQMLRKESLPAETIDLNSAVRDALALLHSDAILRQVSLDFDAWPASPCARADAVQLRQVILNLVLNAMEAIGGPGRVAVQTRVSPDGGSAEIVVADSGPGVAPEAAEGIFQPFFSTKKEGLGLGLSISSSIVAAHGGILSLLPEVQSGLSGAAFCISLPLVQAAQPLAAGAGR